MPYQEVILDRNDLRERIGKTCFNDLFNIFANLDTVRSATEIDGRREERLVHLGPVYQRFEGEVLEPTLTRTIAVMKEDDLLPGAEVDGDADEEPSQQAGSSNTPDPVRDQAEDDVDKNRGESVPDQNVRVHPVNPRRAAASRGQTSSRSQFAVASTVASTCPLSNKSNAILSSGMIRNTIRLKYGFLPG